MSQLHRVGDLEIEDDQGFQRRCWQIERIGWGVMTLILLAALLGLMGTGPLTNATAGNPQSGLWIKYQRFDRLLAPEQVEVHVGPGNAREGRVTVWLGRSFVEGLDVQDIMPTPESVEAHGDRLAYVFRVPNPRDEVAISFNVQPQRWGPSRGLAGLAGGPTVTLDRFTYP
jgi:hypothetical protein